MYSFDAVFITGPNNLDIHRFHAVPDSVAESCPRAVVNLSGVVKSANEEDRTVLRWNVTSRRAALQHTLLLLHGQVKRSGSAAPKD